MRTLLVLALALIGASNWVCAAPQLSGHQSRYLFLAGEKNQLVFRLHVQQKGGAKVGAMNFTLKNTKMEDVVGARLYRNKAPFFSPQSNNEDRAELVAEGKVMKNKIVIPCDDACSEDEMNYFLAVDLSPEAKGGHQIDASLDFVMIDGKRVVKVKDADPKGHGVVDGVKRRLSVYYRTDHLIDWAKGRLTKAGMNGLTNIILFQVQPAADGSVVPLSGKGNASTDMAKLTKAASLLKSLRGERPIAITLGVKTGEFKTVCASPELSAKLAKGLVALVLKLGLDGLDLDYEYPQSPAEWRHFTLFVSQLREEMFEHELLLTTAISAFYCVPSIAYLDQVDLVQAMSYDHGGLQHSSYEDHLKDLATLTQSLHQPAKKVLIGVPMYTNGVNNEGKVMWNNQRGWSVVVDYFKKQGLPLYDHVNHVQSWSHDAYRHNFNGRDLLHRKCAHLLENDYAGLMVWGFETDVDYNSLHSEMRYMHELFIPEQGYETKPMNRETGVSPDTQFIQINFDEAVAIKSSKPIELWECPRRDYSVKNGKLVFENIAARKVQDISKSSCKLSKDGRKLRVALPKGCLALGKSYFIKIEEEAIAYQRSKKNFKGILHDCYWNFSCSYLKDGRFVQALHGLPEEASWTYQGTAGSDYQLQGGCLTLLSNEATISQCTSYSPQKGDEAELIVRLQEDDKHQALQVNLHRVNAKTGAKTLIASKKLGIHDESSAQYIYWKYDFDASLPEGFCLGISISKASVQVTKLREVILEVKQKKSK